tara:strand:+ start:1870 stop:2004 length:135 start_codon:yes stop_codon:yes gene_type:complete
MSKVIPIKNLGNTQGKGSFPRINYQTDPEYKKNFDKIFKKTKKK